MNETIIDELIELSLVILFFIAIVLIGVAV